MEYLQNVVSISFWFTHLPFRDIRYVFIFNEDVELHKEKKKSNSQFYLWAEFSDQ